MVSENGRILMRGRSTNPSCISYIYHSDKAQANGGEVIHNRKIPRFTKLSRHPTTPEGKKSLEKIRIPELVRDRNDQRQHSYSFLLSRPFEDGRQSLSPNSNSKHVNSGSYHRNLGSRNFSLFLKLAELPKANNNDHQETVRGTSSSGFQELKSKEKDPSAPALKTASCSNASNDFHENENLDSIRQIVCPPKKSPLPDEQSEAPPVHGNAIKSVAAGKFIDQLATATSMCSVGASNNHTAGYSLKRINNEESEEMAYKIENVEEEQDSKLASARTGDKRRRTSEIHNLSERKRRDKINKKMRALQALMPNSNKVDKVLMLDNAIEYLKSLQLQLKIMWTMRSGICMPPVMLASGLMQQLHSANLGHWSAMGIGMRLMPMRPTPFLNSPMIPMLPMAVSSSHPPFIPSTGGSSLPSVSPPPISGGGATLVELMALAPFLTSTNGYTV